MEPLTPAQCEALVAQLAEPTTRRAARKKLVAANAVATLLTCLDSENESVVWAAAQSLGELHTVEAVEPLCRLLDRNVLGAAVSEALRRITGKDFGRDTAKWRACIDGPSLAGAPGAIINRSRSPESMFSPSSGSLKSLAVAVGVARCSG